MDNEQVHSWEDALDDAEQNPLTADLPKDAPLGTTYDDYAHARRWLRVNVIRGNTGARWAYWLKVPVVLVECWDVVADKIFNGDVANFLGMLATPYVKLPAGIGGTPMWVLIEPKMTGTHDPLLKEEPVKERYERSKEVYDVETGKVEKLP